MMTMSRLICLFITSILSFIALEPSLYALEELDFDFFVQPPEVTLATRAKWRIFSQREGERKEGVALLEQLLTQDGFKRLSLPIQSKIIFLLLEGYERTGKSEAAIILLRQQLKRPELWKSALYMKASLAKLYFAQDNFKEGDLLIQPLFSSLSSCSSIEKKKVSQAILERDRQLFLHLEIARKNLVCDLLKEAIPHLETIASALKEELSPFQSSSLTRKRLSFISLFALAECYCVYAPEQATALLSSLETDYGFFLSSDEKIQLATLKKLAKGEYPKEELDKLSQSSHERLLLWQIQYALSKNDTIADPSFWNKVKQEIDSYTLSSSLSHYVQGVDALLKGDIPLAHSILQLSLKELSNESSFFRTQYLDVYQETLWIRTVFCFLVDKRDTLQECLQEAQQLSQQNLKLIPTRKECFQAISNMIEGSTLSPQDSLPPHPVDQILYDLLHGDSLSKETIRQLSLIDQLFLHSVALYTKRSRSFEFQGFSLSDLSPPWAKLIANLGQAPNEQIFISLRHEPSLQDAYPKIEHLLLKLTIQKIGQKQEVEAKMNQFLALAPGYGGRQQALLEYFLFLESHPEATRDEKKSLVEELVSTKSTPEALLTLLYLHKTGQLSQYSYPETHKPILEILQLVQAAKTYMKESDKTNETGQKTDAIRNALNKFKEAEKSLHLMLESPLSLEEETILTGCYLQFLSEWADLLLKETVSDHPFLELEEHLQEASKIVQASHDFLPKEKSGRDITLMPRASYLVQEMKDSLHLINCTFKGEYEEAIVRAKALSFDSLLLSPITIKSVLYLVQSLRKRDTVDQAYLILMRLNEKEIKQIDQELALEVAIEKSLCLQDKKAYSQALAALAWVINDSAASSLRIKAMVLRAELYKRLHKIGRAMRQLEAAKGKGGEWGHVAEQKLKELYGSGDDTLTLYDNR